jgi:diguanylate cyclase
MHLRKGNFEVLEAENGRVGIKMARQMLPDLIVCDIAMPDVDGYEVLATLQQDPVTSPIPFIFLTSFGDRDSFRRGMGEGADDFLVKPVSGRELLAAVKARFSRQQALTTGYCALIEHKTQELDYLKHYDPVTGLPNQGYLFNQLDGWLAEGRYKSLSLFHLGVDYRFIQQTLGWEQGQLLLEAITSRLKEYLRDYEHLLVRLETDRFAIILPEFNRLGVVTRLGHELLQSLARPFNINGQQIFIRANMGLSRYPEDGTQRSVLLAKAEYALGQAARLGNLVCHPYHESLDGGPDFLAMHGALSNALERGELQVYYQPQLETQTGQLIGAEALLRWHNPKLGWISPSRFIPLAEKTGLIEPISRWILQTVCHQNQRWQSTYGKNIRIGVNLAAAQFRQPDLADFIEESLQSYRLEPDSLGLELTESMLVQDVSASLDTMRSLRKTGITLSLDDFGTGYSSLSYLKRFPFDVLKIDQSFIQEMTSASRNKVIVASIIQLAHSLELRIVAEGVETQEQLALLRQLGCEEVQGFLFSKPIAALDFEEKFLKDRLFTFPTKIYTSLQG